MPTYTLYSVRDSRDYQLILEIVETSQNIANNTTNIDYYLWLRAYAGYYFQNFRSTINLTIDGVVLLNTTNQNVSLPSANSITLLASGSRVINHNADGSKSLPLYVSFRTNTLTTYTPIPTHIIDTSTALTTIPRASQPTLDVSSQALGSAITISTNRASTAFTHTLKYTFGNQSGTIATGVGASQSWTLPNTLANAIPNNTSGAGTITCETYNGSTLIGTRTVAFTATVPNNATFQPNASISSILEGSSGLGAFTVFIQNISRLRVQSASSGKFGASISQIRVTIDGSHYFGADITSAPINNNGSIPVTLLVTDSRGHSTTITQNVTLVAYFAPKINAFSASRSPNDQGTDLSSLINFEIAPISNQNARYYRVRYRIVGGSWVLLFESGAFYTRSTTHTATGVLNANNSYEVELFVQDSFSSASRSVTISTAFDLLNFNQSGKGLAIGKVSEKDEFEVDLPADFTGGLKLNGDQVWSSGNDGDGSGLDADLLDGKHASDFWGVLTSFPIIETGSNANGSYVKFADGTMIAWSEASITTTSTTALENGGFRTGSITFNFPATFFNVPLVVANNRELTRDVDVFSSGLSGGTQFSLVWKTISSDTTTRQHRANWIAIGRWKA